MGLGVDCGQWVWRLSGQISKVGFRVLLWAGIFEAGTATRSLKAQGILTACD